MDPLVIGVALLLVALILLTVLYATGRIGKSPIRPLRRAAADVRVTLARHSSDYSQGPLSGRIATIEKEAPGASPRPSSFPSSTSFIPSQKGAVAVPTALAVAVGLESWLTPDSAAVSAVEQATGESVTSAFDFHSTIAEHKYKLWSDGSMFNWRGHVGEQQIVEQISEWAPDSVSTPEAGNFAGADVNIFGEGYQVKFVKDFTSIDNIHGDPLIVPDGTLNVPDDALRIDFSQPFDASVLEGHDVIIAEGLTLGGAEDAWESAVGLAAGGIDFEDASDALGDMAIPGLGSVIRVAASGYQRRAALADPHLRKRASGRIARDATYAAVGAGGGGTVGMLVGGAVDVLSLGMTMGTGAMIGGAIGTSLGARKAKKMAEAEDRALIEEKARQVRQAIDAYGRRVDEVERDSARQWATVQHETDAAAQERANVHHRALQDVSTKAHSELATLPTLSNDEAAQLLFNAARQIEAAQPRSPRARRTHRAWEAHRATILTHETPPTGAVLTLAASAPSGVGLVDAWAEGRARRRDVVLAATEQLSAAIHTTSFEERARFGAELRAKRKAIQEAARSRLSTAVKPVEAANRALSSELKLAGR